jgi:hypothetical protein
MLVTPSRPNAQVCVPLPSGIVSWWPGDGNPNDIVGGNNGTLSHGAMATATREVERAFLHDVPLPLRQHAVLQALILPPVRLAVKHQLAIDRFPAFVP